MAGFLPGDVTCNGTHGFQRHPEMSVHGPGWYFTRKEIEENSPSKRDGVDWKKEMYFRKSYCTFLQDLGMRLKLPQVTIATAIIFCHRFFLRHSLARNDRKTIATACMFLAGKVEETPRPLKDVTLVSYEITNKKDHEAAQRIKQKEVYEQQKDLILAGERIVLQTLGWVCRLRTCLCLQFQPHHIAAGAIFLAAKFLKVKLPSDGERVWWQEFDVTPRQLEEVSNQMLELYEQNRVPPSNDIEGATGSGTANRAAAKVPASNDENAATNNNSHTGATSLKLETSKPGASKTVFGSSGNHVGLPVSNHGRSTDYGGREMKHRADESSGNHHLECETLPHKENLQEAQHKSRSQSGNGEEQESSVERSEMKEAAELNAKHANRDPDHRDSTFGQPPQEAIKKIDRDRVKAALEKRRKTSGHITKKTEVMDDDDLIERELEDGIELAAQSEKNKQDRSQIWSKPSDRSNNGNLLLGRHQDHADEHLQGVKSLASSEPDLSTIEEGEVSALDDIGSGLQSPKSGNRKRKAGSSPDRELEGRPHSPYYSFDYAEDRNKVSQLSHSEGDN
ncbi:cyclin-T1-3-like isoform X2 [Prosopis cineraria]|uniref:cyclin-T1-3-like isoform X2 n=1 Tax=Prosopis cineraria TaxID=364024 RepID=UPI00240F74F1|nr:cyclin-T1-3-like isoform X2 [Prosopis cineraria]